MALRNEGSFQETNMRRLIVFNNVTVDGYFADKNGDMRWAHRQTQDPEFNAFIADNAGSDGQLLFGRKTYQMMASYWPTPMALQNEPKVAEGINNLPKVVFSRTLAEATWQNTRLVKADMVAEVRKMKQEPGPDMVILGSGSLVAQLGQEGLIDEVQVLVNPVVLGGGRSMFDGLEKRLCLKLSNTRAFKNGNVLLSYERAA
jgi:dihydrofolate reductase